MVEQNKLCFPAKQTRICKVIYVSPDVPVRRSPDLLEKGFFFVFCFRSY